MVIKVLYTFQQLKDMHETNIELLCRGRPNVEFLRDYIKVPILSGILVGITRENGSVDVLIASSKGYGNNGDRRNEKNELREAKVRVEPNMALQIQIL